MPHLELVSAASAETEVVGVIIYLLPVFVAAWIFFGLTVGSVLIFRRTTPLASRPEGSYRAPGYPVVQILFVLVSAAVVLSVVRDDPSSALRGALLLALGVPVFYWFARR